MTATERSDRKRFIARVSFDADTGCWPWDRAACARNGYGLFQITRTGKTITHSAHRLSWIWHRGEIPAGLFVCHRCDNRACVNPEHLFLGTPQENMDDMVRKGRAATGIGRDPATYRRGEAVRQAKLRASDIPQIVKARAAGETFVSIAGRYGVRHSCIQRIVSGRGWAHVPRPT